MSRSIAVVFGALALGGMSGKALAAPTVFSGGNPATHSASVSFDVSGTTMTVVLSNTATSDVTVPSDVLTAVFFNVGGGTPSFTPVSAVLTVGSFVILDADGQPAGGVVGGEWDYRQGLAQGGVLSGLRYGISSSGLGVFGNAGVFPGANLAGPTSVDGLQYGLVSAGDNSATGNGGISGTGGLIHNSVTFAFTCPAGFDPNTINDVYFLYGTALDEGGFHHPAPGAAALLGLGGLAASRRRRS